MSTHMVQYTVARDRVAENESLIRDILDEFDRLKPVGLTYSVYKLPDGVSFLHLIDHDKGGHGALPSMSAFKAFHADLRARCTAGPTRTALDALGTLA